MTHTRAGLRVDIVGTVQGVGFRPWVVRLARELGLAGRVANHAHGVRIEAFGDDGPLLALQARLATDTPPAAHIESLSATSIPWEPVDAFTIDASDGARRGRPSIPPDLATCADCLGEICDPSERRHRYAFASCAHCGPRFSIALDVPYDRSSTTMSPFELCSACRREYEDIGDRRYHAQPIACPACGPSLRLTTATRTRGDPLREAARRLRAGQIIAIKGLGGYHLACDATRDESVMALRARKRRDARPFAVMVSDLPAAEALAELTDAHRRALTAVERPIVLVPRRGDTIANSVAPDTTLLGLMLPYTPLHHLLLDEVGRPLVMTSGNVSDEPIAFEDDDARRRLGPIADAMLVHDRPIAQRTDDSVVRIVAGAPLLIRRSRGYVPRPIALRRRVARPILAVGAHVKNTFCLAAGDIAWMGPHVGDLDTVAAVDAMVDGIAQMERFVGIVPQVVAHDLHSGYESTRYARSRADVEVVAVQHHHAHIGATMADCSLAGPVLGLAFDGTGAGVDGTAWGGEFLWVDDGRAERIATFRGLSLAGGEQAIREVWRLALVLLDDAFDGDPPLEQLQLFARVEPDRIALVRQMVATRLNTPVAHGVGRYFDAFGALGLGRAESAYEGQIAAAWEQAAGAAQAEAYPFVLEENTKPWQLDLRPAARAAVGDLLAAREIGAVSARFHATVAAAADRVIRRVLADRGRVPVVVGGGCFVNERLTLGLRELAGPDYEVYVPRQVPAGDGGLALGQVWVADALLRATSGSED